MEKIVAGPAQQGFPARRREGTRADRQQAEALRQQRQHRQVPVQGEKDQQRQQSRQFRHDRRLGGILRIVEDGEAEAHLQADQLAGEVDAGEDDAHGEAERDADQALLQEDREAGPRSRRDLRQRRQGRRHGERDGQPDDELDARRQRGIVEDRRGGHQAEDPRQRKEEGGEPGVELRVGDAEHGG
jgi:hypothetical protein